MHTPSICFSEANIAVRNLCVNGNSAFGETPHRSMRGTVAPARLAESSWAPIFLKLGRADGAVVAQFIGLPGIEA